jgi:hypothetical protein
MTLFIVGIIMGFLIGSITGMAFMGLMNVRAHEERREDA